MLGFPPSLIPTLWNIGILHHKKAKLRKHMRQSVYHEHRFTYPQKGLCRPALCVLISLIFLTNFVVSSGAHLGPRLWGCQKVHILQHQ